MLKFEDFARDKSPLIDWLVCLRATRSGEKVGCRPLKLPKGCRRYNFSASIIILQEDFKQIEVVFVWWLKQKQIKIKFSTDYLGQSSSEALYYETWAIAIRKKFGSFTDLLMEFRFLSLQIDWNASSKDIFHSFLCRSRRSGSGSCLK